MNGDIAQLPGYRGGTRLSGCRNGAHLGHSVAFIGVSVRSIDTAYRCSNRTVIDSQHTLRGRRTPQSP